MYTIIIIIIIVVFFFFLVSFYEMHTHVMPYESKNDSLILKIMEISMSMLWSSIRYVYTHWTERCQAKKPIIMSGIISHQKKIDTRYCLHSTQYSIYSISRRRRIEEEDMTTMKAYYIYMDGMGKHTHVSAWMNIL